MIELTLSKEGYDETTNRFIKIPVSTITLEHSLVSLSKWESIWEVPFFNTELTPEQTISYIESCIIGDYNPDDLQYLSNENIETFSKYIERSMTAKKFYDLRESLHTKPKGKSKSSKQKITTSEDLYYNMIQFHIWKECETWPLNRLFALIRVCANRNNNETMSKKDTAAFYREENARRLAKYHSKG